jgi:probable HAF family extracellular repeat protein
VVRLSLPAGVTSATVNAVYEDGRIVGQYRASPTEYRFTTLVWDGPRDPEPEQVAPAAWLQGAVSNERGDYGAITAVGPSRSTVWVGGERAEVPGEVVDIDERGRVLLRNVDADGSAAVWDDGTLVPITAPAPPEWDEWPRGMTDDGLVVAASESPTYERVPWVWRDGTARVLRGLTEVLPDPADVNEAGRIVGSAWTAPGTWHPVRWEGGGTPVDLGLPAGAESGSALAVSEAGDVIGRSNGSDGHEDAWLWRDGVMTQLATLGGEFATARALNDAGVVVGTATTGQLLVTHAVAWEDGEVTDLGTLGGRESYAIDVDEDGLVVGTAAGRDQVQQAVAWLPPAAG